MKYSNITAPQWANAEKSAIDCIVTFDHVGEPCPFTANPLDPLAHGREIFARAASGEFGQVADYVPPPAPPEPVPLVVEPAAPMQEGAAE